MLKRHNQRGDTIIEVTLAFVVFSLLSVSAIAIMNRGVSASQKALEITLVRQQIDSQSEALRNLNDFASKKNARTDFHDEYVDWQKIAKINSTSYPDSIASSSVEELKLTDDNRCPGVPDGSFIMNARTGRIGGLAKDDKISGSDTAPFSQVVYKSSDPNLIDSTNGIWVQSKRQANNTKYVDFHITACWYSASGTPTILGTIVRIYDNV
jgi:type II secretory pathway pseudopilin PulG